MKQTIRLNEAQLKSVVAEAVRRCVNEADYSDFDFSRTRGVNLPVDDSGRYAQPREIKEKLKRLQDALKDVMELTNGDRAGKELSRELSRECYNFYNFISEYYIELDMECRDCEGSWEEDHSDIPFIRKYDDYSLQDYYDKSGKPIDRSRFRKNYKPHGK